MKLQHLFLFLIFFSCNNITEEKIEGEKVGEEDYKIINSCFVHLLLPGPQGSTEKFGYTNYLNNGYPKEYMKNIFFTDELISVNKFVSKKQKIDLNNEYWQKIQDSTFKKLIFKFHNDSSKNVKLNLNRINNTGIYKIVPKRCHNNLDLEIGESYYTFSRIIFDLSKKKGLFYFEDNCAGLCGSGSFIFVEKINGIWEIKERLIHWIS